MRLTSNVCFLKQQEIGQFYYKKGHSNLISRKTLVLKYVAKTNNDSNKHSILGIKDNNSYSKFGFFPRFISKNIKLMLEQ